MSESYFPNHGDANGTQLAGYPGMPQQRTYEPVPPTGHPMPDYQPNGYAEGPPPYGPNQPPTPGNPKGSLPGRVMAALVAAGVLVLVLGGFAFVTHGNLGDAETKADGLSESLKKANASVNAKQSEIEAKQKELASAQQQVEQMGGALQVAMSCATQLDGSWDKLFNEDIDGAVAAYEESREACDQLAAAQSSSE